MNELLKLDAIVGEGDIKEKRKFQVKRVQKYVEILDAIKAKNSKPQSNGQTNQQQQPQTYQYNKDSNLPPKPQSQRTTVSSLRTKPQAQYSNGSHLQQKSEPEDDSVSRPPLKLPPKYYNSSNPQTKAQSRFEVRFTGPVRGKRAKSSAEHLVTGRWWRAAADEPGERRRRRDFFFFQEKIELGEKEEKTSPIGRWN
ncbi:BAG family molecular chaperone regulator 2-like isoform X2 [Carex littledalei]|uniref:BAG family molecular chaperone regulator 2-like isoform X2 n=1 Tax=Carex littledalei TaxID=544730 RepID=A0A833QWM3_9POAL|nr:BAG family molecular chaperone regulator 2-like isoform X2 [Carex littledalei]